MTKRHLLASLTLLIILVLNGGQFLYSEAASMSHSRSPAKIDAGVWEAIATSPTREATFVVSLHTEGNGGPEQAIDAQFRLEAMLGLMREMGGVRDYQAFYGANIIKITGGVGVLRLLDQWPELESVLLYQPGESWELQAEAAMRSYQVNATGLMIGKVTVSSGGAPLSGIRVTAYLQTGPTTWNNVDGVITNVNGEYTFSNLASGIYRAKFDDPNGDYATQFYNNQSSFTYATNITVTDGQVTSNINADMVQAGKISGTISMAGGGALQDIGVSAWTYAGGSWQFVANAISSSSGTYTIGGLPPGTYRVRFGDIYSPPRYLVQWYDGKLVVADAQDIYVSSGATVVGINAAMGSYGSITGNIKADGGTTNLAGIDVDVFHYRYGAWILFSYDTTDLSGNYVASGLETDNYRVQFSDPLNQFATEFYNDKLNLELADNVAVSLGHNTPNINAQLALETNQVSRSMVYGWNLISLPVVLADSTLPAAFDTISESYGDVYTWDACGGGQWKVFNQDAPEPVNTLNAVGVVAGYWVNMNFPATLSLNGIYPLSTSITLCSGWNMIGYPSLAVRPVEEALASIAGKYTLVRQYRAGEATQWKTYSPTAPPTLNTLKEIEPGYGYWIYMTQPATLDINGR